MPCSSLMIPSALVVVEVMGSGSESLLLVSGVMTGVASAEEGVAMESASLTDAGAECKWL
jgi:hypothetical protein